jgi:T5SS/PEP-CTERM-associated repeat protein
VVTNVNGTIGDKKDSTGSVSVIGLGSSWQNSGILTVGGDGTADLTIDTGSVTAGGAGIGSNFGPVQVTVTNHGSLTILGDVSIGGAGTTDVTIEKGATFENDNSATIGGSGGDTKVTVTGAGSAWTIDGTGSLTLDDKGSLFVMDGGTVTAGTITLLSGSLLNGQGGNIIGSVVNQGGTMTSGDATGVLSITGNYTQTAGSLLFEIDGLGPAQFDQLVISGLANITGGTIDIVFGNGFVPAAGESFELISAGLGLIFTGATFDVTGLPPGMQFTDSIGANGFSIGFGPASQSAPEPAAAVLFGLGLAVVVVRRRLRPPVSLLGSKSHGNCGRSTVRNW